MRVLGLGNWAWDLRVAGFRISWVFRASGLSVWGEGLGDLPSTRATTSRKHLSRTGKDQENW